MTRHKTGGRCVRLFRSRAAGRAGRSGETQPADAQLERVVDFIFEAGWLKKTARTGWAFLGTGHEDVAQHSFRVALIAYILAKRAGADPQKAALLGLFHDLHEARTSDLNYMNQRYTSKDERRAQADAVAGTGLDEILAAYDEFEARETLEARLAKDADQLDLLFNLKEELDKGNAFARDWIEAAQKRLKTEAGREVCASMLETDHNRWWFGRVDRRWWVERAREYSQDCSQKCSQARPAGSAVRGRCHMGVRRPGATPRRLVAGHTAKKN